MAMLDDLDDQALDNLPFGVVCLNEQLAVVRMNRIESERSGIQRWRAIGRPFFGELAPGPTNQPLADHVRAFVTDGATPAIMHTFARRAGLDPTTIELQRGRGSGRVYLCIRRD